MGDVEDETGRAEITLSSFLDRLGLEEESRACVWEAFILGPGVKSTASATECLRLVAEYREARLSFRAFCMYLQTWLVALTPEELEKAAHCMLSGHPDPEPEVTDGQ